MQTTHEQRAQNLVHQRRWRGRNPERAVYHERKKNLKRYGLTPEQYDVMLASQNGVCAICAGKCKLGRRLAVDHDHDTGRVRGLLCSSCNQGLGRFLHDQKRLAQAIRYLLA